MSVIAQTRLSRLDGLAFEIQHVNQVPTRLTKLCSHVRVTGSKLNNQSAMKSGCLRRIKLLPVATAWNERNDCGKQKGGVAKYVMTIHRQSSSVYHVGAVT